MNPDHPRLEAGDDRGQSNNAHSQPGFCKRHPILTAAAGVAALIGGAAQIGTCQHERELARLEEQERAEKEEREGKVPAMILGGSDDCSRGDMTDSL
ncbi:MAG: hypothetical protein WCT53_00945, partial [Candidatus Gracilibacteria bacterium]